MDWDMNEIPNTGQSSVSAYDHRVWAFVFQLFDKEMTELDFDIFIPNVDISLSFKMV